MGSEKSAQLPFSARYSLPAQVSGDLGEVSWETVVQLSSDFQFRSEEKRTKVKKLVRELQLTRLLLMERIRRGTSEGAADPRLLVDLVKLLQHCEDVAVEYDVDLKDFSSFVYLLIEKLKKEKLAKHSGDREMRSISPMEEELTSFKARSEPPGRGKGAKKGKKLKWKKRTDFSPEEKWSLFREAKKR